MDIIVVGAGISGAVTARLIVEKTDAEVLVIDRRSNIGGNCFDYPDKETGIIVHKYGPHIFHTNEKEVWDFVSRFTEWKNYTHMVKASINEKLISLPFNLNSIKQSFPQEQSEIITRKLLEKYGENSEISILTLLSDKDTDIKDLAEYVYENVFKNYTLKQWGITVQDIDKSVLERVPVRINYDDRYFTDKYQGIPIGGYTVLINNILNHKKITVRLNTDYKTLNRNFDRVYYSGAIDEFFDYRYGELPYRSIDFDTRIKDIEYFQPVAVINYPNENKFTRITEHKHFLNQISKKTVITTEYPKNFEDGINERYYPFNTSETQAIYEKYLELAKEYKSVRFIGRLGDYKYYNIDKAISRVLHNLY